MTTGDVDVLVAEYAEAASRVNQLAEALAAATAERNAVVRALADSGLLQREIKELTGLTEARLRTALWAADRDAREGRNR